MGDQPANAQISVKKNRPWRRFFRVGLIATLVVVGLVTVSGAGYAVYLRSLVTGNVTQADLLPEREVQADPSAAAALAQEAARQAADASDVPASSLPVKLPDSGMNILVVGIDSDTTAGGRSDVIILAHVNQALDRIHLVHFPRDLYVSIPGHAKSKINAAYAYGGSQLLVSTVQDLLGVVIDHVVVTGFDGFKAMTDAVGGIDVEVTEPSVSGGYRFVPGTMHMGGDMALAFVRERKQLSGGDISRGQRQQAFLKALMTTVGSGDLANPVHVARIVDAATTSVTVDTALGAQEMLTLARATVSVRKENISFITAPFAGFAMVPSVGSVELLDVARMRALGDAIRTDRLGDYQE